MKLTWGSNQAAAGGGRRVTKGTVSLAFSGIGKGIDLGITFGEFVIEKQSTRKKAQ